MNPETSLTPYPRPDREGDDMKDSQSHEPESKRGRNGIVVRPPIERLRAKLVVNQATGCHEWTGALDQKGYARVAMGGQRNAMAHRVAYEAERGPVPPGLTLDHICRNQRCCNPEHLEPVTAAENSRRSWPHREIVTHCLYGHEFTPENTYRRKDNGRRNCLTCMRERDAGRRR